jgi:RecA/RadA recombinase
MSREKKKSKSKGSFSDKILGMMHTAVFLKAAQIWLDTKNKYVNGVLGSEKYGIPAGKMYEIQGKPHAGKTSITMYLAALAQKEFNAFVIWVDLENSLTNEKDVDGEFHNSWAAKFRLDTTEDNFYRAYPKVLVASKLRKKGKKTIAKAGDIYIQAAESIFDEVELVMKEVKVKQHDRPIFVAVDSIANLQTALSAGSHEEKNMRTNLDRAIFLSGSLPKWQTLAYNFTAWVFFINQIRTKQGMVFGDPEYSPGGKSLEHNCHVRVKMRPFKRGIIIDDDDNVIGARGSIINIKNKAGGSSKMGKKCGYSARFKKRGSKMWNFFDLENLKQDKE